MRQNVLDRIPQMGEITLPTNYLDWNSKQLNLPPPTKERNEWPSTSPRHPHYVLVRSDDANPQRLGKCCRPECSIGVRGGSPWLGLVMLPTAVNR